MSLALLLCFIPFLVCVFASTYLANQITKEVCTDSDGVLKTCDSDTAVSVKSGGKDPTFEVGPNGLMTTQGGKIGVSCGAAFPIIKLSSTLPDAAFFELRNVRIIFKDMSLEMFPTRFRRLQLRTSACGSVVHISFRLDHLGATGHITLDNTTAYVDTVFDTYLASLGRAHLLGNVGSVGFGRKLDLTNGTLEGSFNFLANIASSSCVHQPLPHVSSHSLTNFRATTRNKKMFDNNDAGYSKMFKDSNGQRLALAGVLSENSENYQTWTDEVLVYDGWHATLSTYALFPYTAILEVIQGDVVMTMNADSDVGYDCKVGNDKQQPQPSGSADDLGFNFVGVVEEDGMVLRQYRMSWIESDVNGVVKLNMKLFADEGITANDTAHVLSLIRSGILAEYSDFFDVDTDPGGKYPSGTLYRTRTGSSIYNSRDFDEVTYVSIQYMSTGPTSIAAVLKDFNVTSLEHKCFARYEKGGEASGPAIDAMLADVSGLPVHNRSGPAGHDPTFHAPPRPLPWDEYGKLVLYQYDRLAAAIHDSFNGKPRSPQLQLADTTTYWVEVFKTTSDTKDAMSKERDGDHTNTSGPALGGERRLVQTGSAAARRLTKCDFDFEKQVTATSLDFALTMCNSYVVVKSSWQDTPSFKLLMLNGKVKGPPVDIWPLPPVTATLSGALDWNSGDIQGHISLDLSISLVVTHVSIKLTLGGKAQTVNGVVYLTEIYAILQIHVGPVTGIAEIIFSPVGKTQKDYYKTWKVTGILGYRFKMLCFHHHKSFTIFTMQIGI